MNHKKWEQCAYDAAKASKCFERKVGAVLVDNDAERLMSFGHNHSPSCVCNTYNSAAGSMVLCPSDVVHAEVDCLQNVDEIAIKNIQYTLYITQPPCNGCLNAIANFCEEFKCQIIIHLCEQFLKFDTDKLRFDLVPPEWPKYDAEVLTYGAKKYKPDNWRNGEITRYIAACERHWNGYRSGEWLDSETNLPHLAHLRTNIGFLISIHEGRASKVDDMIKQINEVMK